MQGSWTVPAGILVALPAALPLAHGALVEPTAVAVHDVRHAGIRAGEKIVVVGGGPIGLLVALVAASVGAAVVTFEVDARRRMVAAELGLTVVDPAAQEPTSFVNDWTSTAGADVAFEVSGSAAGVNTAVEVLAARGRLVMVAIHAVAREVNLFRLFWRELTIVGARVYERQDFERAVELMAGGDIPAERLTSNIVPLEEVDRAFHALEVAAK
jgi:2-desacetyl-2-hydroxyethyl bacteriochlorophyllide A dehydrogenase